MTDPAASTIAYYDQHAEAFAVQTADADLSSHHERFIRHVRPGGRILDAGCGVGRDALAFAQIGFEVVAFDASVEMVRHSRERTGGKVQVHLMRFEQVEWQSEFDGIWTCASLLHVPPAAFNRVALRLWNALRPGGAWYISFKLGQGVRTVEGRTFVDHTDDTLRGALAHIEAHWVDTWTSEDVRPGRNGECWVNVILTSPSESTGKPT